MLKIVVVTLVVLMVGVLALAASRPDAFRVERTLRIRATPEKLFALINDLQAWLRWSPYEAKDPVMKRDFSGPQQGVGATYAWDGNREVGAGELRITNARPHDRIDMALTFTRPFAASHLVEFRLVPEGDATAVTWSMSGAMPFVSKLMSLFIDMDRMIGHDFEAGLARLKTLAESA